MPVCKYCNARISNHDKDLCPVCGGLRPLDGAPSSETIEFTQGIDITDDSVRGQTPRTKNNTMLLFILIGWTGLGFNYLRYKISKVLIWLVTNLAIMGGLGSILCFATPLSFVGFIISVGISYLINIVIGLIYKFRPNMKDGQGELIL